MDGMLDHDGLVAPELKTVMFQAVLEPTLVTTNATVHGMIGVGAFEPERGRDDYLCFGVGIGVDEEAQPGGRRAIMQMYNGG